MFVQTLAGIPVDPVLVGVPVCPTWRRPRETVFLARSIYVVKRWDLVDI